MKRYPYLHLYILSLIVLLSCSHHSHDVGESAEDHEEGHSASVMLEPEEAAEFGIEYEIVEPGNFHDIIKTSGVIESSNSDIFTVTARKNGIISLLGNISEGTVVTKGEKIGYISSEGVQGGDANQAAVVNLQAAETEYKRLKPLFEEGLVTSSVFKEAERKYKEAEALAGKNISGGSTLLTSPSEGNIRELYVKTGDYVEVGTPIATIAKNSLQILKVDLPLRESKHLGEIETANFIPEGRQEALKLTDLNGKKISGKVNTGSVNGYIPVYFSFTGTLDSSPGGFAEVYLLCKERQGVVSIPRSGLIEIQGNKYAYVVEDGHHYEKRLVKTGANDGERIEILTGLAPGEKIVSKGASIIRMAEVSSVAPPSHSHNH